MLNKEQIVKYLTDEYQKKDLPEFVFRLSDKSIEKIANILDCSLPVEQRAQELRVMLDMEWRYGNTGC